MYKVIIVDNLNRDYQPQRQLTLEMDKLSADNIANLLNSQYGEYCYHKVVPANQELNLQSTYDLTGETMPYEHWLKLTGAKALPEHVAKYWYSTTILKKTIGNEEQEWL